MYYWKCQTFSLITFVNSFVNKGFQTFQPDQTLSSFISAKSDSDLHICMYEQKDMHLCFKVYDSKLG